MSLPVHKLFPVKNDRSGDIDRRECSCNDADQKSYCKLPDHLTPEDDKDYDYNKAYKPL
jgi:hypothetical protein